MKQFRQMEENGESSIASNEAENLRSSRRSYNSTGTISSYLLRNRFLLMTFLNICLIIACIFLSARNLSNTDQLMSTIQSVEKALSSNSSQLIDSIKSVEKASETQAVAQTQLSQYVRGAMHQIYSSPPVKSEGEQLESSPTSSSSCPELDFYATANKFKTDKVTWHTYHHTYQHYFPQIRCKPLKMLEIGLGCGMSYGPGASYYLWLEYFPLAEIYFIEIDGECAEKWKQLDPRVHVYVGDQANVTFLNEFKKKTGGDFDFIVDDGGHDMNQQIISFETLLSSVKPGGFYFIEDLLTSLNPDHGGGDDDKKKTTLNYIKDMLTDFESRNGDNPLPLRKPISSSINRIDCTQEICAFTKQK
jgi:hypothetical protein